MLGCAETINSCMAFETPQIVKRERIKGASPTIISSKSDVMILLRVGQPCYIQKSHPRPLVVIPNRYKQMQESWFTCDIHLMYRDAATLIS